MARLVGIDIGGTFTDFVLLSDEGIRILKTPSLPESVGESCRMGLLRLGVEPGTPLVHGTTVATNTLLERTGATIALVGTKGFEDVLEIGRQNRPQLYTLDPQQPDPLVPSDRRLGVKERLGSSGVVLQELDEHSVCEMLEQLEALDITSVAVCLLNSYSNGDHEQQLRKHILDCFPDLTISLSSELIPEYREYERTSTTVANAYVSPVIGSYLNDLSDSLTDHDVSIMQSSAHLCSVEMATREAAKLVLSGPAAGVAGAFAIAKQSMEDEPVRLLTLDMGGTSTDVCLCDESIPLSGASIVGGVPLRFPAVDIHTVGAGGGSIAWIDDGNMLRVGPQSAGATPGPACYERGGTDATVTDANLFLGRIPALIRSEHGHDFEMNPALAEAAINMLADRLGISPNETALGIIRLANASMEQALRKVSVASGHDPRDYTMVPFGGAGPLHACALADALEIARILVVPQPGVLSAYGLCVADHAYSRSISILSTFSNNGHGDGSDRTGSGLTQKADVLRREVESFLNNHPHAELSWSADVRYVHQSHELSVEMEEPGGDSSLQNLIAAFEKKHEFLFGYCLDDHEIELVTLRLTAKNPALMSPVGGGPAASAEPVGCDSLPFTRGPSEPGALSFVNRTDLIPGVMKQGPFVIAQSDCTVFVDEGWCADSDHLGNLHLRRS